MDRKGARKEEVEGGAGCDPIVFVTWCSLRARVVCVTLTGAWEMWSRSAKNPAGVADI